MHRDNAARSVAVHQNNIFLGYHFHEIRSHMEYTNACWTLSRTMLALKSRSSNYALSWVNWLQLTQRA